MPRVFVAAGSNVDPERNLAKAAAELVREFPDIEFSPWYRNKAVGFEGADFINFVVGFSTDLPVHDVVTKLRAIEALCGRRARRAEVGAAFDGSRHPSIRRPGARRAGPEAAAAGSAEAPFMLGPIADIVPDLVHPTENATIGELWQRFDRAAHPMTRVEPSFTSPRSGPRPPRESGR